MSRLLAPSSSQCSVGGTISKCLKERASLVTALLKRDSVGCLALQLAKKIAYEIRESAEMKYPKHEQEHYLNSTEDKNIVSGVHVRRMLAVDAENADANHQSCILHALINNSGKLPLGISCFAKCESTYESMDLIDKFCPPLVFEDIRSVVI